MPIVIDPEFSVFRLVERMNTHTQLNHRRTMSFISREMENASVLEQARGRIFSGFQRMSKFLPQMERYKKVAEVAESVYVFGIPDIEPPPIENITYVYLQASDQLAKEWFLVVHGQDYYSALATEELSHIDDPDHLRQFRGLWSFEKELVGILEEWLSSAVDARPLFPFEPSYQTQRHLEIINHSLSRFATYLSNAQNTPPERDELSRWADEILQPKIAELNA